MKKNLLIILLLTLFIKPVQAQFGMGKIEEIEAVQGRKLIVMIEEPRERMIKKLTKKPKRGSVEEYKADLIKYNALMKEVVEKFWPHNKENISYKTYEQIEALKKSKSKEYAVLCCLSAEPSSYSSGFNFNDGLYWTKSIKLDFEDSDDDMFTMMVVNTIEDFGRSPVFQTPLFDVFPTKAAIAYGLATTKNYFEMRIRTKKEGGSMRDERKMVEKKIEENAPRIKDKTLLIRAEWLDEELTEANFKDHYPYKYKICDREFMDNVVMTQNSEYAYGVVLPNVMSGSRSNSVFYFQYVFDGKDGTMMAMVMPSQGSMMAASGITGKAGKRNFTFKIMEKLLAQINGKK
ncbi:MAG: hypothetical protein JNK61_09400 [Bacteroidia bacterium]|nr:hypothetical protein [Bacteroidia bacterium]